MPLKQSSRNVVFIQTDVDGQKIFLLLQKLKDNAGNSEEVWMTSQIDKYIGQPKTVKYSNMCRQNSSLPIFKYLAKVKMRKVKQVKNVNNIIMRRVSFSK